MHDICFFADLTTAKDHLTISLEQSNTAKEQALRELDEAQAQAHTLTQHLEDMGRQAEAAALEASQVKAKLEQNLEDAKADQVS